VEKNVSNLVSFFNTSVNLVLSFLCQYDTERMKVLTLGNYIVIFRNVETVFLLVLSIDS
jgi:hypothetical protein